MAKRKHPNARSIRTGQTIYQVGTTYDGGTFINTVVIGSPKLPDPDLGEVITVVSPWFLRRLVDRMEPWLTWYTFYSRRRAESFRRQLQEKLNARNGRTKRQ